MTLRRGHRRICRGCVWYWREWQCRLYVWKALICLGKKDVGIRMAAGGKLAEQVSEYRGYGWFSKINSRGGYLDLPFLNRIEYGPPDVF